MKTDEVVEALAALAQPSRLELFRVLVRRGPAGLPAGQIAARLGIPATTLSFHLSQLTRAGLLRSRRDGRSIVYAADYERMGVLVAYLNENCCQETGCEDKSVGSGGAVSPQAQKARRIQSDAPKERKKDGDETRGARRRR